MLEALASTDLNLLLDVGFNREVAEDGALYWNKDNGNLARLIEKADSLTDELIDKYAIKAKSRIEDFYSWEFISEKYKRQFMDK